MKAVHLPLPSRAVSLRNRDVASKPTNQGGNMHLNFRNPQATLNSRCSLSRAQAAAGNPPEPVPNNASLNHSQPTQQPSPLQRVKDFVLGGNSKLDKKRLAELGMGAFAAYGIISNINAGVLITLAWLTVVKTTGLTPLADGMWPKFLAVYAGLWISSHFMRPIRLSLALAAAPAFDRVLVVLTQKLRINKAVAFGIMLIGVATVTITGLTSAIWACGGFPDGLPLQQLLSRNKA